MKKSHLLIALIASTLIAIYFYSENEKNKKKLVKLDSERRDLAELLSIIKSSDQFTEEMKITLERLANKYKKINLDIANEIAEALSLFQIEQYENAVKSLVKIMEHLLTKKLEKDNGFIGWLKEKKKQYSTLHLMLEYSKECKLIKEEEHAFFNALKTVRNKEAHEINFNAHPAINAASLIVALHAIIKLTELVYPRQLKK